MKQTFIGLLLFQLGCATIISGSTEKIEIAVDKSDSKVFINEVLIGVSQAGVPLVAEIPKKGSVEIQIRNEQCQPENYKIQRQIDPTTFLGLLIDGGLISILVVDILATNAFVKASQSDYDFQLRCYKQPYR